MTELVNTNRLRVSWTNLREHWDAPPFLFSHYKSGDHGKRRPETNISLHIFGRGFHVKWRPSPRGGRQVSEVQRYSFAAIQRDDDDYADVVKDDSGDWVQASDYDALAARLAGELEHERDACSQLARGAVIRAEAAEARVRELEHALRRASERLSWLRDHHCSSDFARGQAKMAADECWRVQAGERAAASARAVQEPACQHDLQQSAPTVRVWHSIFEPEKQSAECNVCGSRWTLNGVGRG